MLRSYGSYQESFVPWLRRIPSHWKWVRNGAIFDYHQDLIGKDFSQFQLLSLTTEGVKEKEIENVKGKVPASYESYQKVYPGDMIFCLFDLDVSAVFAGNSQYYGMITSAYDVATPKKSFNAAYLKYWFQSVFVGRYYKIYAKSVRFTIKWDNFKSIKSPVPPLEEQDQIVRYLDWQVSHIDRLIQGYRREIELLEEEKETLINQAVSRGIDHRPLKPSTVSWMPEIPENWKMIYAKKLFQERKDKAFAEDEQLTSSQKYGIISQKKFMDLEGRRVTIVLKGNDILKHVGKGDFVISMRSFQGGLEFSDVEGKISSAYVMLIPREGKVCNDYFKYLFKSKLYIKALQGTSDLVRDGQALRYANFAKVSLPEISYEEQARIAAYIQKNTYEIDKLIPLFKQKMNLLKEYRIRLISDVVTGQMDVRGVRVPDEGK